MAVDPKQTCIPLDWTPGTRRSGCPRSGLPVPDEPARLLPPRSRGQHRLRSGRLKTLKIDSEWRAPRYYRRRPESSLDSGEVRMLDRPIKEKLMSIDGTMNTHMLYFDGLHRDHGAIALSRQALLVFCDTIIFGNRNEVRAENEAVRGWQSAGNTLATSPLPPTPWAFARLERYVYENMKIASGFELHLKARLIEAGFVVHVILNSDAWKSLHKEQRLRPILVNEMTSLCPYISNQTERHLPGITKQSLNFSWIVTKPAYISALGLPAQTVEIIDEYRQLRNQIHLPGDGQESPKIQAHGRPLDFLLEFANTHIVDWANSLLGRHPGMAWQPLQQFS